MILLNFLHYLKPFRMRLAAATVGMLVIAVLGTVNILMIMPFLDVLLQPAMERERQAAVEQAQAEAGAAEPAPPEATTPPKEPVAPSPTGLLPGGFGSYLKQFEGKAMGPIQARKEAVEAWFAEQSRVNPFGMLILLSAVLIVLTLIKGASEYFMRYHLSYTFFLMALKMREDIFRNILAQDYLFFVKHSPGYLISRINSDVNAIRGAFNKIIQNGVQQPLNLLFYSLALIYISPQLTLITAILAPVIGLMIYSFGRALRKNTKKQKKKSDKLSSFVAESLYNVRLIKAFGTENDEIARFVKKNRELLGYMMARRVAKFASSPIMEFLGMLASCGALLLGGYMILGQGGFLGGTLTVKEFVVYLVLMTRFYKPLKSLSGTLVGYQTTRVSAERILEMLALKPEVTEPANPRPFEKLRKGIELRNVVVRYANRDVLRGVSLKIERGENVAFVGETGSGKTTLVNLTARLFDPNEGQVLIDGVDMREYRIADLREKMGIVTQQTLLFDDTVANNIAYGSRNLNLTPEERMARIVKAARDASAHDFIMNMEGGKGYDTKIGPGGARLSGGQCQRLAIARALYREPEIMIFDEATSALDSQTQAQVQEAINRTLHDRTALIISHRLSAIRNVDRIFVIEDGRIVESGSHEQLLARNGKYAEFYRKESVERAAPEPRAVEV